MKSHWEVEKWPATGDKTPQEIFLSVGEAMSSWALIEQGVAILYSTIKTGKFHAFDEPALLDYMSIPTAKRRIEKTKKAFRDWHQQQDDCPFLEPIEALLLECDIAATRRNEFAHGRVANPDTKVDGWYLYPGLFNPKRKQLSGPAQYRYTSVEISQCGQNFLDLERQFALMTSALMAWMQVNGGISSVEA
jgi:hypothetical protein